MLTFFLIVRWWNFFVYIHFSDMIINKNDVCVWSMFCVDLFKQYNEIYAFRWLILITIFVYRQAETRSEKRKAKKND